MSSGSRKISIRLSLEDAEKVKAQLAALGVDGEKALTKIEKAAKENAPAMKAMRAAMGEVGDGARNLSNALGPFANILGSLGAGGIAAGAALGGLVAIQAQAIKAFAEAEQVSLRLDAALKATSNTTGFARSELDKLADSLSKATAIDDEDIKSAAATLATFGHVSGEAFSSVLEQAANLSATFGGELSDNVVKLGDVMENLAGGKADGLQKAFKALSVEEENQIKTLAESGRGYEAQAKLLSILQSKIGGAAAAEASGLIGSTRALANAWEDLMESIAISEPVRNAIQNLTNLLNLVNQALNKSTEQRHSEIAAQIVQKETKLAKLAPKITGSFVNSADVVAYQDTKKELDDLNRLATALTTKMEVEKESQRIHALYASDRQKAYAAEQQAAVKAAAADKERIKQRSNLSAKAIQDEEKQREAAIKSFEKQQQAINDNIQHTTDRVVDFGADAFETILKDGTLAFDSLGENILDIMRRTFAQLAAEAIIRPIVQPIVSSVVGGSNNPLGTLVTGRQGGGGLSFSNLTDLPNINLFGSGTSSFINDIGGSLGFAVEGARPFSSFVGPMPNAGGGLFSGTLSQTLGNAGYGFIGSTAAQLFGIGGKGIGSTIGSTAGSLIGSAVGGPVGAIAGGFLGDVFGGLFGGEDDGYQKAVEVRKRTQEAGAISEQISKLIAATAETTQFAQAVEQIKAKFAEARTKAQEYGLSIDSINKAEQQQIDKLKQAFKDTIENQIAALENNPSSALAALKKAQDQRYSEAIDAEADLSRVRKLNQLETEAFYKNLTAEQITAMGEMARAIDRINAKLKDLGSQLSTALQSQLSLVQSGINDAKAQADAYRTLAVTLRDQIFNLRTGNLTTLSQSDALGELRNRFSVLMSDAKGGNQSALRALPQVANSLLEASSKYFGSTEAYAKDFASVTDALKSAGLSSDQFAGAEGYRTQLLESQLSLLKSIQDNLSKESPDAKLLKEQLTALGVIGDLVGETNNLSASQAQLLSTSNAIQDVLAKLTAQNASTSQSIINVISGSNSSQLSIGQAIVQGTHDMRDMLGKYISVLEQRAAQEQADKLKAAADAAKQAKIDAAIADVRQKANAIQSGIANTPKGDYTENMHEWVMQFDPKTGKKLFDMAGDKGGQYEQQRAEAFYQAASSATQQLIKTLGFTGNTPPVFLQIATKYSSGTNVGGVRDNGGAGYDAFGINDYQGILADILNKLVSMGAGGNKQLVDYAKTLNWFDIPGSLTAIERKAIDLGLRGFASGTLSAPAGMAWVGEQGPELVRFRGGEQVIPANASASMHQADVVKALQMHASVTVSQLRELRSEMASLRREFFLQRQENRAA